MFNENLKELSSEVLKKRNEQFQFGYLVATLISIGGCQKSFIFFFAGMMLAILCMSQSEKIKKELQSRL
jgi:hypothetical protein